MANIISRLLGGKKGPSYEFTPYSGLRPPRIDTEDTKILRPTQKQLFDILMARSKGEDVGYAPEWLDLNKELITSELAKQEEDQVRSAQGSLSAAGLSGNPRAIEATTGRIRRDTGRNLSDSMKALAISDLERKNQERDTNTGRLQQLNSFNFGQEDTAANFDLNVYNAEEGNKLNAVNSKAQQQAQSDEFINGLLEAGATAAGAYFGGPVGAQVGSQTAQALTRSSGTGVAPNYAGYGPKEYIGSKAGYRKNFVR